MQKDITKKKKGNEVERAVVEMRLSLQIEYKWNSTNRMYLCAYGCALHCNRLGLVCYFDHLRTYSFPKYILSEDVSFSYTFCETNVVISVYISAS